MTSQNKVILLRIFAYDEISKGKSKRKLPVLLPFCFIQSLMKGNGMNITAFIAEEICGVVTPLLLLGVGLYLLFLLKGFPFTHPLSCFRYMLKQNGSKNSSPLRAFCMALGGTLGVGNISGVALALQYGGAGSLLWMWISALLAMLIKYAEILLALDQKQKNSTSPPHRALGYIWDSAKKHKGVLSTLFCSACLLTAFFLGGMMQSNAVAETFYASYRISPVFVGVVLFLLTLVVIMGGGKRISSVTFALIPFATLLYILLCMGVIFTYANRLPSMLIAIFRQGTMPRSMAGGVMGYGVMRAVQTGCKRGLLSNEAGCGTAPMAHATSQNPYPEKQAMWGIFEVFVDTVVLCSLTGFAVLLAGDTLPTVGGGMALVANSLRPVWGKWADMSLCFAVLLFAFATVICWSYYGSVALSVFTLSPKAQNTYRLLFCLCVFLGALLRSLLIWHITDILLAIMTAINLYAILCHRQRLKDSLSNLPFLSKTS